MRSILSKIEKTPYKGLILKILTKFSNAKIEFRNDNFPSEISLLAPQAKYAVPGGSTSFGIIDGTARIIHLENEFLVKGQNVFSLNCGEVICDDGSVTIFTRFEFSGFNVFAAQVEKQGRLVYIDGCKDTLLISPPRIGDPCLNALYFPEGTDQTFHIHPSIRLGYVLRGSGIASSESGEEILNTGDAFCIEANERHRFKTSSSSMVVIAYHPESDWGPSDEKHPMINRTYYSQKK